MSKIIANSVSPKSNQLIRQNKSTKSKLNTTADNLSNVTSKQLEESKIIASNVSNVTSKQLEESKIIASNVTNVTSRQPREKKIVAIKVSNNFGRKKSIIKKIVAIKVIAPKFDKQENNITDKVESKNSDSLDFVPDANANANVSTENQKEERQLSATSSIYGNKDPKILLNILKNRVNQLNKLRKLQKSLVSKY